MCRGAKGCLAGLAVVLGLTVWLSRPASAEVVPSQEAGGTDNLPPAAVSDVVATPGAACTTVEIEWSLSPDDFWRQTPVSGDLTSGGTYVNTNDVAAYQVWRQTGDGEAVVIGTVESGVGQFTDTEVVVSTAYIYGITAVDAAGNESDAALAGGEPVTIDTLPEDFDRSLVVDFDDYTLFADNFGRRDVATSEPKYDLDENGVVNLSDFFLFADKFGYRLEDCAAVAP